MSIRSFESFVRCVIIAALASAITPASLYGTGTRMENRAHITITRGQSPWAGMTESFAQEQANKRISAVAIDPAVFTPLPHLAAYTIGSDPLMGRSAATKRVVVSSAYFSDLERADATRIAAGTTKRIGRALPAAISKLGPERLVLFLIEAQIIETYWHIEAKLRLVGEQKTAHAYTARFAGTHIYFTNERNEDPLDFAVSIDLKTGEMGISGSK